MRYIFNTEEYGDLISEYDEAATQSAFHQYDALGSTDTLLDDAASAADRYRYRAFGKIESHEGTSDSPYTFVGRQSYYRDVELDLYLLDARYYNPEIGQFISNDPSCFATGDLNTRCYGPNNSAKGLFSGQAPVFLAHLMRSCQSYKFASGISIQLHGSCPTMFVGFAAA